MSISVLFLDATGRLRTAWRFAIFLATLAIVWVAIGIAVGVAVALFLLATGRARGGREAAEVLKQAQLPLTALAALPVTAATFAVVVLCRRLLDRRSVASMGLSKPEPRWTASAWTGLAAGGVPMILAAVTLLAMGRLRLAGAGGSAWTAALIPVFLLGAFQEELVCRGYLLRNMVEINRPVWGVLLSSLLFSLMHSLNPHVWGSPVPALSLFLSGVLLALAYLVSGNLWFPSAMHFAWNFFQGAVLGIPVSGMAMPGWLRLEPAGPSRDLLTGGAFGLEGSLLLVCLEVAGIVFFLALLYRRRASPGRA